MSRKESTFIPNYDTYIYMYIIYIPNQHTKHIVRTAHTIYSTYVYLYVQNNIQDNLDIVSILINYVYFVKGPQVINLFQKMFVSIWCVLVERG